MEMKKYQKFSHGTYSNMTSFFITCKMLKTSKMKWNQTGHVQIWLYYSLFTKYEGISTTFEIYFLMRFISKMKFYSVHVKGSWAHLAENNSRPWAKITTIFRLSWKCFDHIIIKTFLKHLFYFEQQNHVMLFKVSF